MLKFSKKRLPLDNQKLNSEHGEIARFEIIPENIAYHVAPRMRHTTVYLPPSD